MKNLNINLDKKTLMVVGAIAYAIFGFGLYYVSMPSLNWHDPAFWTYLTIMAAILAVPTIIYGSVPGKIVINSKTPMLKKAAIAAMAFVILFPVAIGFISARFFNASEYASRIAIETVEFDTINEVDFTKTAIIDRDTTESLGDRVMGQMSELVSQFIVSEEYTQISMK